MTEYNPSKELSRAAAISIIVAFFFLLSAVFFAINYYTILPYVRYHCYNFVSQREALQHGLNCVSLHP